MDETFDKIILPSGKIADFGDARGRQRSRNIPVDQRTYKHRTRQSCPYDKAEDAHNQAESADLFPINGETPLLLMRKPKTRLKPMKTLEYTPRQISRTTGVLFQSMSAYSDARSNTTSVLEENDMDGLTSEEVIRPTLRPFKRTLTFAIITLSTTCRSLTRMMASGSQNGPSLTSRDDYSHFRLFRLSSHPNIPWRVQVDVQ